MKLLRVCLALAGALAASSPGSARAERPRDEPLNPPPAGTFLHLDAIWVGAQASVENRAHLEEGMSMLQTRATGIVSYPYAEGSVHADLRVFLVTVGASAAYQWLYRDSRAPTNDENTRSFRNQQEDDFSEFGGRERYPGQRPNETYPGQTIPWYEGRLRLVIPLDTFLAIGTGTLRHERRAAASFDWFHVTPHDAGAIRKIEGNLFYRHRDLGAVGPYLRYLNLPRDGSRESEMHYGAVFLTRPGWKRGTDLLLLQVLSDFGTTKGKFGQHSYQKYLGSKFPPFYFLGVYRATLPL